VFGTSQGIVILLTLLAHLPRPSSGSVGSYGLFR